jgi:hypothetical protein
MTTTAITLLPQVNGSDLPAVPLAAFEGHQKTIACDCYVAGIEAIGTAEPWGWRYGPHENIDHHAPVDAMARVVSSANLAIDRFKALGAAGRNDRILITHTDCDSILSAGIMGGWLAPDPRYGAAAIAADHTGEPNEIADLLQALQERRDVEFSLAVLQMFESGHPLSLLAQRLLDARLRQREAAAAAVERGSFTHLDHGICFAQFLRETEGEFFPALLPTAQLIVIGVPHPNPRTAHPWAIKVRRGPAMADGRDLRHLDLAEFDPNYGGRWNAGSNKRGGGTAKTPGEWVEGLVEHLTSRLP